MCVVVWCEQQEGKVWDGSWPSQLGRRGIGGRSTGIFLVGETGDYLLRGRTSFISTKSQASFLVNEILSEVIMLVMTP